MAWCLHQRMNFKMKWIDLMFCFCLILLSKKLLIGTTSIKYEPSIIFLFHNLHLQTRFWTWFVVVFCNLKSGEANEGNFKSHWRNLTLILAQLFLTILSSYPGWPKFPWSFDPQSKWSWYALLTYEQSWILHGQHTKSKFQWQKPSDCLGQKSDQKLGYFWTDFTPPKNNFSVGGAKGNPMEWLSIIWWIPIVIVFT